MIERPAVSVLRVLAITYGKYAQVRVRNFLASHLNHAVLNVCWSEDGTDSARRDALSRQSSDLSVAKANEADVFGNDNLAEQEGVFYLGLNDGKHIKRRSNERLLLFVNLCNF